MTSGLWVREEFDPRHVQLLMGERWLITLHRGPEEFLEQVRRHYSDDFTRFARTPSFLLYECWDYLIATYKRLSKELEDRLEKVQAEIFRQVDDEIFASVAELTRDVMALRKTLLLSREVLNDVATRRSSFVAESSQPFLDRLVGTLDRMAGDLTTQREMLAETLSLYMGMVSHRTNKVVNRLTVVSVIFLPLSVLVAIYGSNFQIPEVHWKYGYLYLWTLILVIAGGLLTWMRRQRWW
jgi:magnesium transporter